MIRKIARQLPHFPCIAVEDNGMVGKNTHPVKHAILSAVFVAAMSCLPSEAAAQTVDYGSLQELFGEPVTTTATSKPQKASEAPVAMEIVTDAQIRRMGVTSLPEVLNRVNGITSWQPTRSWADVGVRGQNTTYNPTLLVLVNGRQVYVDSYGFTDWSLIPVQLEEIRQIEVVKGPTTALYGFNAVNGVVNIVTYNPKYDNVGQAGLVAGTGQYGRAYGFKTLKLSDNASVRFSGSLDRFDEFDRRSKTAFAQQSTFQDGRSGKLAADGLVQLTDKTQLRLEASYAGSEGVDVPTTPTGVPADKGFWSTKASLVSETDAGLIEANLYTNAYDLDLGGGTPGSIKNRIIVAQLQDLFKIGTDHTFRLQGEYRYNTAESTAFVGPGAEISYDAVAAGGMWNWAITPAVEWTNALRVDHLMLSRDGSFSTPVPFVSNSEFDQDVTDYSINSGLVWKATDMDTLRVSYGRGIQAPSLLGFAADISLFGGAAVFAGSPNLDTTIVKNYEVGYDRLLNDIGGKFRSSIFYKKTERIAALGGTSYVSGFTGVLQAAPIGDSSTAGVELGLAGKINTRWDWDIGYVYQNTVDDFTAFAQATPSPVTVHYDDTIPHHVLKGHIGYADGPWESDLYGEAGSSFNAISFNGTNYDMVGLDGYYTLGGRVGYAFDDAITVAVYGSELARARVANNYGLENERRVFLSLSRKF